MALGGCRNRNRGSCRSRGLARHSEAQRPSSPHKIGVRDGSLFLSSGRAVKAVRLELAKKGFELGLAEILGQERNHIILVMDFEGNALRTPGDDVAVARPIGLVQEDVQIRRKMLGVPNFSHDDLIVSDLI